MTANGEHVPGFSASPISYLDMLLRENKPGICVAFLPLSCVTDCPYPAMWLGAGCNSVTDRAEQLQLLWFTHFLTNGHWRNTMLHLLWQENTQNLAIIKCTLIPASWDIPSAHLSTSSLLATAPTPMWQQHGVTSLIVQRQHIFVQRALWPLLTSCTWYLREQISIHKK